MTNQTKENVLNEANSVVKPAEESVFDRKLYQHDAFGKRIFRDESKAPSIVKWICRDNQILLDTLDLDKVEVCRDSFIDEDLREHFVDVLYRVTLKDGSELSLCVLIELKTSNEPLTIYQIFRYIGRIWFEAYKEAIGSGTGMANWKLPAVLPAIIHHGESPFTAPLQLAEIQQQVAGLEGYFVYLSAMLIDFKPILSLELPEDVELAAQFLVMQGVFEKDVEIYLVEAFKKLLPQWGKRGTTKDVLKHIFHYAATSSTYFTVEKYKETIKKIETIGGDMPVLEEPIYLIDVLEAKGRKEGEAKGKIEMVHNLLHEGVDYNFIVRVTGLSLAEIKRVQADGNPS